jgi:hypothetical protein
MDLAVMRRMRIFMRRTDRVLVGEGKACGFICISMVHIQENCLGGFRRLQDISFWTSTLEYTYLPNKLSPTRSLCQYPSIEKHETFPRPFIR